MDDRILGVLGGMGPLAGAEFMRRLTLLTPATLDQDHVPAILWSDPRIPPRTNGRPTGALDPLPWMRCAIAGLEQAGCGAIAIACNNAHGWYPDLIATSGVPILHIVDAAAADLRRIGVISGPVGLMATQATLDLRLYQDRLEALGYICLLPTAAEMTGQVTPAIAAVKANRPADGFEPLAQVAQNLTARGAACVVLGCTEIPLAMQTGQLDLTLVDTIDALARAAIAWAKPGKQGEGSAPRPSQGAGPV